MKTQKRKKNGKYRERRDTVSRTQYNYKATINPKTPTTPAKLIPTAPVALGAAAFEEAADTPAVPLAAVPVADPALPVADPAFPVAAPPVAVAVTIPVV
jgi:hypothetical protein